MDLGNTEDKQEPAPGISGKAAEINFIIENLLFARSEAVSVQLSRKVLAMKYALFEGRRSEAQRGIIGSCPGCGHEMIPKCGEQKVHHWAHKSRRTCDPWWENETEWHRTWKDRFPDECQEARHIAKNGEVHIADVRTVDGHILEFQHSKIDPAERRAREAFYGNHLIWVVDTSRLKRAKPALLKLIENPGFENLVNQSLGLFQIWGPEIGIVDEWRKSTNDVWFDLCDGRMVYMPKPSDREWPKIALFDRADFLKLYCDNDLMNGQSSHSTTNSEVAKFRSIKILLSGEYRRWRHRRPARF